MDDDGRHRERLWPSAGIWLGAVGFAFVAGIAVAVVVPWWATLLTTALVLVLAVVGLVRSAVVVEVAGGQLRAGAARIPVSLTGRCAVVDAEQMRLLRGRDADPRAFLCQRGWLPRGVVVEVDDPEDPTPYWLLSSRRPERLAAALRSAPREPSGRGV